MLSFSFPPLAPADQVRARTSSAITASKCGATAAAIGAAAPWAARGRASLLPLPRADCLHPHSLSSFSQRPHSQDFESFTCICSSAPVCCLGQAVAYLHTASGFPSDQWQDQRRQDANDRRATPHICSRSVPSLERSKSQPNDSARQQRSTQSAWKFLSKQKGDAVSARRAAGSRSAAPPASLPRGIPCAAPRRAAQPAGRSRGTRAPLT